MKLNHTLGELNDNDFEAYGEWLYHVTVMGTPSATEPWGWQVDGHHLVINYFVLGDQVVMTPSFFGSEPVIATKGKYAGTKILQEEQAEGLAFINGLDAEAAIARHRPRRQARQRQRRRGLEGQRRRPVRGPARVGAERGAEHAVARPDRALRRQHGRRPRKGEDGRKCART